MTELFDRLQAAVASVRGHSPLVPRAGIVLGSWLADLADEVEDGVSIPFREIAHLPRPTMLEEGRLVLGVLAGQPVALLTTRVHLYEGYGPDEVVFPVQLLAQLGAGTVVLTNAAGSLNPALPLGGLVLIRDQINLTGRAPLAGRNDPRLGPRYVDMAEPYDAGLRQVAGWVARELGIALSEGVYLGIHGPAFQTPAEIALARQLGADVVGMSTVLETIAARHAGLAVLGISWITDVATGAPPDAVAGAVLQRGHDDLARLLRGLLDVYRPPEAAGPPTAPGNRRK